MWRPGGCQMFYGYDCPLDDEPHSRPYITWDSSWAASLEVLSVGTLRVKQNTTPSSVYFQNHPEVEYRLSISEGVIASERDNIALKLGDWLKEDKALRRFSIISFDRDVPANRKAIRRQVEQGNIVGFIAAHKPDFEFANFTIQELIEITARIDERKGFSGELIRNADWVGVRNGGDFEKELQNSFEETTKPER